VFDNSKCFECSVKVSNWFKHIHIIWQSVCLKVNYKDRYLCSVSFNIKTNTIVFHQPSQFVFGFSLVPKAISLKLSIDSNSTWLFKETTKNSVIGCFIYNKFIVFNAQTTITIEIAQSIISSPMIPIFNPKCPKPIKNWACLMGSVWSQLYLITKSKFSKLPYMF